MVVLIKDQHSYDHQHLEICQTLPIKVGKSTVLNHSPHGAPIAIYGADPNV